MRLNFQKTVNVTSILAVAVLLLISATSAFAKDNTASIDNLTGYATVTDVNGDVKRLANGDTLNEGDVLNTGAGSAVSITLASGK